ncbi:unnamed protein product [Owenia fusiformis]|uniref:Metalloendopeptidase n=1 Tax=Owenia fusiformis TaxID=6347 RepID=A0A8J1U5L0_OWEFU|nr:unnamed protein product [Owenia fusiformis]
MTGLRCILLCTMTLAILSGCIGNPEEQGNEEDVIIIEGDIAVTSEEFRGLYEQHVYLESLLQLDQPQLDDHYFHHDNYKKTRQKRAVTGLTERKWSNQTVPYVIGPNITDAVTENIQLAMSHWEKNTCIRFINRTYEKDYIYFTPGHCGCCSFVGRQGGKQHVTLSPHCANYGVVVHELGHVIGFWHEHSRPDRDKYVKVLKQNIIAEKLENFDKKFSFEIDSLSQPYDYYSIMHYRRLHFSKNGKSTIEPLRKNVEIGQRDGLSPGDMVQARLLYNCPKPLCYEELTGKHGNLSTPHYPISYLRNHNCTWIIHIQPGQFLSMEFTEFSLEKSTNCTFDFVEVRQGIDEMGKLIGRFCGEGQPGIIESYRSLWIRFRSDSSITSKGFLAHYNVESPMDDGSGESSSGYSSSEYFVDYKYRKYNIRYKDCVAYKMSRTGNIESPLVPVPTSRPVECSWVIDGGNNSVRIQLTFDLRKVNRTRENCVGDIYIKTSGDSSNRNRGTKKSVNDINETTKLDRYSSVRHNCSTTSELVLTTSVAMILWSSTDNSKLKMSYVIGRL